MKVYVHIGLRKTGTTAIQWRFGSVRDRLPEQGYCYPETFGRYNHNLLPLLFLDIKEARRFHQFLPPFNKVQFPAVGNFLNRWQKSLRNEIELTKPDVMILSSEYLSGKVQTASQADTFVKALGGFCTDIEVIVYAREPIGYLTSWYSTFVRGGGTAEGIEKFVSKQLAHIDYAAALQPWVDVLGKGRVTCFNYDACMAQHQSVVDHFADHVGIPNLPPHPNSAVRRNPRLTAETLQILLEVNRRLPKSISGQANAERGFLSPYLLYSSVGNTPFHMPLDMAVKVAEECREWLELFNERFLSESAPLEIKLPPHSNNALPLDAATVSTFAELFADVWKSRNKYGNDFPEDLV